MEAQEDQLPAHDNEILRFRLGLGWQRMRAEMPAPQNWAKGASPVPRRPRPVPILGFALDMPSSNANQLLEGVGVW